MASSSRSKALLFVGIILSVLCTTTVVVGKTGPGGIRTKQEIEKEASVAAASALHLTEANMLDGMKRFSLLTHEEMKQEMDFIKEEVIQKHSDDPELLAQILSQIDAIIDELYRLEASNNPNHFKQTVEALDLLKQDNWTLIWERQDFILEAVSEAGEISMDEVALFETDSVAWEKELKNIWELVKKAAEWEHMEL